MDAEMTWGEPGRSSPVVISMAWSLWMTLLVPETSVIATKKIVCDEGSITGVPVIPTTGPRALSFSTSANGATTSPPGISFTLAVDHTDLHPGPSASNAYKLSFSVATNTTLWRVPPIVTLGTQSGCAKTQPSTGQENSFPNVALVTFCAVRAYSWEFTPERDASFLHVFTPARSVTPMVAEALLVTSALLVAVIVKTPGPLAVKVAAELVWPLSVPPEALHET